jgi:hypothetical protein
VVFRKLLPQTKASWAKPQKPWPADIQNILTHLGIDRLYKHQAEALDCIRSGKNIVTATPTASGKSLIYNIPVIESILGNPDSRALYIFPLKALAQDQLRAFEQMTEFFTQSKPDSRHLRWRHIHMAKKKDPKSTPQCYYDQPGNDSFVFSCLPPYLERVSFPI